MAAEVSWWTRAKKDTEDRPHLTSLADLDQQNGDGSPRPPEGDATASAKRVTFADDDDESALGDDFEKHRVVERSDGEGEEDEEDSWDTDEHDGSRELFRVL